MITVLCRRWRPVPERLYGRARLSCTRMRGHWQDHHNAATGWSWAWNQTDPLIRTWTCNGRGDNGQPHGVHLDAAVSYDSARAAGWRILLERGRIDAMCPACARPDPATVALCRDLERSVRR